MTHVAVTHRRLRGRALLGAIAEGTAASVGDEFLRSLVRNVAQALGARLAFVGEAAAGDGRRVDVLACWHDGRFEPPFSYDTTGQPCALLPEHPVVAVPEALTERFPADRAAAEMGLDSYLAVCLRGADGRHLGHLAVLDSARMEVGEEDVATLRIFAARAGAELERRAQAAELAASRARVVEVADAERRRLGRDLHDGAQQRLIAVSNFLRVARRRVDDAQADALLERAADELSQAHAELRELARGLYPVALAERGLPAALGSLAEGAGCRVELHVDAAPLPEPVAAAVYFIVAECLANAGRHAGAESVVVSVARHAGTVELCVADDGAGGADPARGTGLRGLADRVAVLGGRLTLESPPGDGTRVSAAIPLPGV
ncbi:MAG TPA: histidine kinase [Solirubrobacteraceae bacterium]|nr:histidine kinase [Solirubrobacteraceae bacterium]